MNTQNLTSPCGLDCKNCSFYLAKENDKYKKALSNKLGLEPEKVICNGCRNINGECQALKNLGFSGICKIFQCVKTKKVEFCFECSDFPCNLLHPMTDRSNILPHNLKVFNLCTIRRIGLKEWEETESRNSLAKYYNDKLDSCM